ncbi:AVB_G0031510.mRNA.1.CDS.1 [Saccharomyces cerevisiae]|nr:CPG_1a_G0031200.mRNA.1.CDS.1 [Saccharomyces cerevisiae]CAI4576224.1 AIE_G0031200.mRNA.1.CDS.1 [Saccharomyces cerevisiae]CAI4587553.1 AVB_G0031510.mRNA.1.CDS.1 [Saccharomyces cerevisiae]CAI6753340.1 AIE_G0031200.mRNA.1.CDS.1 [Saccharomyces cerevisiae]CAI7192705.1 AVB_G0031510.mRNA.1.CDS.1 [Saccharomyces cerevisiae]
MTTNSHDIYEPYKMSGQKYVNMTKKEELGICKLSLTQEAFIVNDKFDYKTIIGKLEVYGLCVVKNFIEPSICDVILNETESHFCRYKLWQGSPFPKEATVATRSVLQLSTILKDVVCDQNYFPAGKVTNKCTGDIHLNPGIIYKVGACAGDQGHHREDIVHHTTHHTCERFKYGSKTMVGLRVAFTDMN